jgi:hypothetical protein
MIAWVANQFKMAACPHHFTSPSVSKVHVQSQELPIGLIKMQTCSLCGYIHRTKVKW